MLPKTTFNRVSTTGIIASITKEILQLIVNSDIISLPKKMELLKVISCVLAFV